MLLNYQTFLGLIALLLLTETMYGQVDIDSTTRTSVYYPMLESFEFHRINEGDIVFLGNSITFWADWPVLFDECDVKNRGIPGDNTFGLKERLYEVTLAKPAKVFIMIGINDLGKNTPDSVILKNYQEIIQQIQSDSPQTKIYFQTLLPTNEDFGKLKHLYHKDKHIRYINKRLKLMGKENGITVIDLYSHFAGPDGKLLSEYTWDGVHLRIKGYLRWVEILREGGYLDLSKED